MGSLANPAAFSSYSAGEVAMNSGSPAVRNKLAATRLAKHSPASVSSGRPVHRASIADACAL